MHLVNTPSAAVPFGLLASAERHAADIARDCASAAVGSVEIATVPFDAPYGPWWVIQVKVGALTRYIADDKPAVLVF